MVVKTGGVGKGLVHQRRSCYVLETCKGFGKGGGKAFGDEWRWRVRGELYEGYVCANKDAGSEMPKTDQEPFNDVR